MALFHDTLKIRAEGDPVSIKIHPPGEKNVELTFVFPLILRGVISSILETRLMVFALFASA